MAELREVECRVSSSSFPSTDTLARLLVRVVPPRVDVQASAQAWLRGALESE